MTTAQPLPRGEIIQQLDGTYELFPLPTDQDTLYGILTDCLAEWENIRIGLLIPGAVWEIKPPRQPRTGFLDGYLTVDFEDWHLHLCIGEHASAPPEVARLRRTARAELYRRLNPDHQPTSWASASSTAAASSRSPSSSPTPTSTPTRTTKSSPFGAGCTCGTAYGGSTWARARTQWIGWRRGFGMGDMDGSTL